MNLDATAAHERIESAARSNETQARVIVDMQPGQAVRQGDIYVMRVAGLPKACTVERSERQLAPGRSRGSRHVAEGEVTLFEPPAGSDVLQGPFIVARARFRVTHPEHAHFELPEGVYRVTYQRDFSREGIARVLD